MKEEISLKVTNLGPLAEASVSLKPLTIFIGPNNAGKSYLAVFIHSLLNSITSPPGLPRTQLGKQARLYRYFMANIALKSLRKEITSKHIKSLIEDIEKKKDETKDEKIVIKFNEVSEEVRNLLEKIVHELIHIFISILKKEVERLYGCKLSDLNKMPLKENPLEISILHPFYTLNLFQKKENFKISNIEKKYDHFKISLSSYLLRFKSKEVEEEIIFRMNLEDIIEGLIDLMFNKFPKGTFYLPAARSGIIQTHKQLSSMIVKRASRAGIEPIEIAPFSGSVGDFLSSLLDISSIKIKPGKKDIFKKEINFLEREILKGSIEVIETEKILYPEIYYKQEKIGRFPLHRTSSMVSELAPLSLYLKYFVEPKSYLIIEEPESHLHPDAQLIMAKLLSRLVRKNLYIIITTHSDFLLERLNNLISISRLSKKKRKSRGFNENEFLNPEEVGAYLFHFNPEKEGFISEELEITREDGIIEEEFIKVAKVLNKEKALMQR